MEQNDMSRAFLGFLVLLFFTPVSQASSQSLNLGLLSVHLGQSIQQLESEALTFGYSVELKPEAAIHVVYDSKGNNLGQLAAPRGKVIQILKFWSIPKPNDYSSAIEVFYSAFLDAKVRGNDFASPNVRYVNVGGMKSSTISFKSGNEVLMLSHGVQKGRTTYTVMELLPAE